MNTVESPGKYGQYAHNILLVGDFIILNLAFAITCLLLPDLSQYPLRQLLLLVNVAYLPSLWVSRRVHKTRSVYMERVVRSAILAMIVQATIFVLLLFFLRMQNIGGRYFAIFYPIGVVLLACWWIVAHKLIKHLRKKGRNFARVIIIGTGPTAMDLYNELVSDAGFGYKFKGFFDDNPSPTLPSDAYVGSLDEIDDFVRENKIDEVYYTLSGERNQVLHSAIATAENNVARFFYVPQINRFVARGYYLHTIGSMPVLSLMDQPLESLLNRATKRTFDLVFSSVFLIFFPLILIPVGIAIKLSSPGSIFFRQVRTGYRGRDFYCWKFRTMRVNADADSKQAERNDPRKTRLGSFLRKTSIDELPQFINVWLGDMSVVGPRPHMLKHTAEYSRLIDKYMVRHYIKPGITGWAQVSGFRGQTEELWQMEKRVEYDVWYIKHWSFLLDLKIIYRTVANAIRGEKNAF